MEDSVYVFSIDVADTAKVKKFKRQHRNCHMGMTADKFSYTFCPTSLGTAITVECSCGQKLLLGDFIDHDDAEYDEDKHKTLTKQDLDNQKFEDAALRIIRLKNPRIYRMCTMEEQSFDVSMYPLQKIIRYFQEPCPCT